MSEPEAPTILDLKPSWAFTLLRRLGWLVACLILGTAGLALFLGSTLGNVGLWIAVAALAAAILILLFTRLERDGERYLLTAFNATWESGIFRRLRVDAPIEKIQHAVLYRSIRERLFGLGTIGLATAGSDTIEVVWRMIKQPDQTLATIRSLMAAAPGNNGGNVRPHPANLPTPPDAAKRLPIIGLAGGIGAGKSTVGRVLASLGCLVIDSDQRSRAALDRADVRDQLIGWWGEGILTPDRKIDRSKVAGIVFSDPSQRERLEGLVHPIVRQDRAAMIAEAEGASERPTAVVIDAPLLFEAGLDSECDAILFVDAPIATRLARVQATRGWSEAELLRRESAQIPIDQKKTRSTHVIDNTGTEDDLRGELLEVLNEIRRSISG